MNKQNLMSLTYQNPPLIKVMCEFDFVTGADWRPNMVAPIGNHLRSIAPHAEIDADDDAVTNFYTEDKQSLIQVSKNRVVITENGKYDSWENFLGLLAHAFNAYLEVAKPAALSSISLRYVNRLELPNKNASASDYFRLYPHDSGVFDNELNDFAMIVDGRYAQGRDLLRVELFSQPLDEQADSPKTFSFLLAIQYMLATTDLMELFEVGEWLQTAHGQVKRTFVACLTEKTRGYLGELYKNEN